MKHPFLWLIRGYQRGISPLMPPSCRFHPSCSEYAYIAIDRHGILKGGGMALWRLLRCNPWSPGGFDPVDQADRERHEQAIAARDAQAGAPTGMGH